MKKLLVVMVITLMMASGAYALQADWQVDFELSAPGLQSMGTVFCAGWTGSSNGTDFNDQAYPSPVAGMLELDVINGGAGTRTVWDIRDIPATAEDVQIFNLAAYANGGAAVAGGANLKGYFDDTGGMFPLTSADFFVYLFAGNYASEAALKAAVAQPLWVGSLANYEAFKAGFNVPVPLAAGQTQNFTVWAGKEYIVPEPGSMLALFSGLVGLVGFGIRRRR